MSTTTRLSPSCQQIISSSLSSLHTSKLTVRSCMGDPDLSPTIINHRCNSVVLTPSGLYTDMAITIAHHIWRHHRGPDADLPGINVHDLEVHKPLIVKDINAMSTLWLEVEASLTLPPNVAEDITNAEMHCVFHSISPSGTKLQRNGHCSVSFEWHYGWLSEWTLHLPHVLARIAALHASPSSTTVPRNKAYALFESFVQYTGNYQNMSSCTFDPDTLEATASLSFLASPETDHVGPYYHDGSCHISGFVCNAVEQDRASNAFISNGVGAMKLSPLFDPANTDARICNYVQMRPLPNDRTVLQGDVYVLQDGQIVGVWEGVRFKKIPRKVLNVFLPPPRK